MTKLSFAARPTAWSRNGLSATLSLLLIIFCAVSGITPGTSSAFTARITNSTNTAATAPYFSCTSAFTGTSANALFQFPLTELSGSTLAADTSGNSNTGTYQAPMTATTITPMACTRDTGAAYVLNGSSSFVSTTSKTSLPATFTVDIWFNTSVPGGKLMGSASSKSGSGGTSDRNLYLAPTGQIIFGTANGATIQTITSPQNYADSGWHQVIGTFSPASGMKLYVDGSMVTSNSTYTGPVLQFEYWRIGNGDLTGWPSPGTNAYFTGKLRFAAFYNAVLTATDVANFYQAGR